VSCLHCGEKAAPSTRFCPRCGRALEGETVATGVLTPTPRAAREGSRSSASSAIPPDDLTRLAASSGEPGTDADFTVLSASALAEHGDEGPSGSPGRLTGRTTSARHADSGAVTGPGTGAPAAAAGGPLVPGQNFGIRYHIIRILGVGGMGAVYQAWDEELGVAVALKVIRPEMAQDLRTTGELERRFKRELLLARQVTHRNVVRIHDLGEVNGIKYITMPYIEGDDLATILKRDGQLTVAQTLKIARQVVAGMVAAHGAGIVHRDLKPANIMIDADGEALVMDFGIARSAGGPGGGPAPKRELQPGDLQRQAIFGETVSGAVVGTVQYMAPEQAKGRPADQRADIYALGLIFYDMLVGKARAGHAQSAIAELQARMQEAPPPVRTLVPEVPEAVDRLIARCLDPDPEKRYATSAELEADLARLDDDGEPIPIPPRFTRRMMLTAAVLVMALVTGTWWLARGPAPVVEPPPVSLLIADFDNRTDDPVFAGTVEQGLTIALEEAPFINVYPRARARQLGQQLLPDQSLDEGAGRLIAAREGIKVLIAGSIAREAGRYTLSVRAIDLEEDAQIGGASIAARTREEVLPAVGRLASDLRQLLGDTAPASARVVPSETFTAASLEAMRAYVRGQDLQVAGRFNDALEAYQEAVSFDPGFGRAYAGMGAIYGNLKQDVKAEESYQAALKHLNRMTDREKYSTLGGYYLLVSRNYEKAIENYETLVTLYPADRAGHANLAYAYFSVRSLHKAVAEVRQALELEPNNILQRMNYAMYAMYAGDFETAIAESNRIPEDSALFPYALLTVGRAAAAVADFAAALTFYDRLAGLEGGASLAAMARADLAMARGRYAEAVRILVPAVKQDEAADSPAGAAAKLVALGEAYAAMDQQRAASQAVNRAMSLSRHESILFPAALVLIDAGDHEAAESIAEELEGRLQGQTSSYARLIAGQLALRRGRLPQGIEALREARQRYDSWFARLMLGQAYLQAGHFPEALAEFELCLKRKGEATDVFFFDSATLRYLPPVYHGLARTQEALGNPEAAGHDETYLTWRTDADPPDPIVEEIRGPRR
jgi:eukaryotic-like serine/threonine-protein kinase